MWKSAWIPLWKFCHARKLAGFVWKPVFFLIISKCWLLLLNPGAREEHLASQLSWLAVWLWVTRACAVYLVDELVLVSLCVLCPIMVGLMVILLTVFFFASSGFSSMGSWCYSREGIWKSRTKFCCIASGKWNASRISPQEFGIRSIMF